MTEGAHCGTGPTAKGRDRAVPGVSRWSVAAPSDLASPPDGSVVPFPTRGGVPPTAVPAGLPVPGQTRSLPTPVPARTASEAAGPPAGAVVAASVAVPPPETVAQRVNALAVGSRYPAERAIRPGAAAERLALRGTVVAVLAVCPGTAVAVVPVAGRADSLSVACGRRRRRGHHSSCVTVLSAGRVVGRRSLSAVTPPESSISGRRRPLRPIPYSRRPKRAPRLRPSRTVRRPRCLPSGGTVRFRGRGAVRRCRPATPRRPRRRWCSARYRRESWWKRGYMSGCRANLINSPDYSSVFASPTPIRSSFSRSGPAEVLEAPACFSPVAGTTGTGRTAPFLHPKPISTVKSTVLGPSNGFRRRRFRPCDEFGP